ncbi:MAG: vWA domain-containing protein [Planctomycetota bacterium]
MPHAAVPAQLVAALAVVAAASAAPPAAPPAAQGLPVRLDGTIELRYDERATGSIGPFGDDRFDVLGVFVESTIAADSGATLQTSIERFVRDVRALKRASEDPLRARALVLTAPNSTFEWPPRANLVWTSDAPEALNHDVRDLLTAGSASRTWFLGPGGAVLGVYGPGRESLLSVRGREVAGSWAGDDAERWAAAAAHAEDSWSLAFGAIRRGEVALEPYVARDALSVLPPLPLDRGADESEVGSAAVRTALRALLAYVADERDEGDERPAAEGFGDAKRESVELDVLQEWLRHAVGETSAEDIVRRWIRRDVNERLRCLIAIDRLCLRGAAVDAFALQAYERARRKDWETRSSALRVLAARTSPGFRPRESAASNPIEVPRPASWDRESVWQVRLAWAELLGTVPHAWAVEELVELRAWEQHGRVRIAAERALGDALGVDLRGRVAAYRSWLDDRDEEWEPAAPPLHRWRPPRPTRVPPSEALPQAYMSDGRVAGETIAPPGVLSTDLRRVVFLLDASESMSWGFAEGVARELERELGRFTDDRLVGVVTYAEAPLFVAPRASRPALTPASPAHRRKLLEHYRATLSEGKTDYEAALEAAFRFPDVDEVVLLSDGRPTAGERRTEGGLVGMLDRLNATRRVRISTVFLSLGEAHWNKDLRGGSLPHPTDEDIRRWTTERSDELTKDPAYRLLARLASVSDGDCRLGFANRRYSKDGVPIDD